MTLFKFKITNFKSQISSKFQCEALRPQAGASRKRNIFSIVPLNPAYKAGLAGALAGQMTKTNFLNHWNLFVIWPACAKPLRRRQVLGIW
jgi:hypothetical protein